MSVEKVINEVEIAGPIGSLCGEMIKVDGAKNIVVIIPGSGPTNRDGNSLPSLNTNTYKLLAEGLAAAGISSIRIDKRGMFSSAAAVKDPNNVSIGEYAKDALQWVGFANQHATHVWIAGHSEGGLVALAAARTSPKQLHGLILLATAGRKIGPILLEQIGNSNDISILEEAKTVIAELEAGRKFDPSLLSPAIQKLFPMAVQGFWIDLLSQDPTKIASQWIGSVLIIQGDSDIQVTPYDAQLLANALPQAEVIRLEGATHMLKSNVVDNPYATYQIPELPLHPNLLLAILKSLRNSP